MMTIDAVQNIIGHMNGDEDISKSTSRADLVLGRGNKAPLLQQHHFINKQTTATLQSIFANPKSRIEIVLRFNYNQSKDP